MTTKEWETLLAREFSVSNTVASNMYHALITIKKHDEERKRWLENEQ